MTWSVYSLDGNPIENLWWKFKKKGPGEKVPSTKDLLTAICENWNNFDKKNIALNEWNLFLSELRLL